jgi:hypothetical protein
VGEREAFWRYSEVGVGVRSRCAGCLGFLADPVRQATPPRSLTPYANYRAATAVLDTEYSLAAFTNASNSAVAECSPFMSSGCHWTPM